jgi:hypothetical protein
MEGRARGAPLCKKIFFVSRFSFLKGREKKKNKEKRRSQDSVAVRARTHCNQTLMLIKRSFSCICVFYVFMCLL